MPMWIALMSLPSMSLALPPFLRLPGLLSVLLMGAAAPASSIVSNNKICDNTPPSETGHVPQGQ
jgi:hypothetical protein